MHKLQPAQEWQFKKTPNTFDKDTDFFLPFSSLSSSLKARRRDIRLMAPFPGQPGKPAPERLNQSGC